MSWKTPIIFTSWYLTCLLHYLLLFLLQINLYQALIIISSCVYQYIIFHSKSLFYAYLTHTCICFYCLQKFQLTPTKQILEFIINIITNLLVSKHIYPNNLLLLSIFPRATLKFSFKANSLNLSQDIYGFLT